MGSVETFRLQGRAKHVLSEVNRVAYFRRICLRGNEESYKVMKLGKLMNKSHESLKTLYECSSDRLDELVDICRWGLFAFAANYGTGYSGYLLIFCIMCASLDFV